MRVSKGGGGGAGGPDPPPLENHINTAILVRIPRKITKYEASIQRWAIIGTPAKCHLNGASLACQRWPAYNGIWILSSLNNQTKKKKLVCWWTDDGPLVVIFGSYLLSTTKNRNIVKSRPPLSKLSGSAHYLS